MQHKKDIINDLIEKKPKLPRKDYKRKTKNFHEWSEWFHEDDSNEIEDFFEDIYFCE